MQRVVRLSIVDPRDSSRTIMKNQLLGLEMMWLEAECSRYDSFYDVISQTQPDIGLVALDSDPEKALALVAKISQEYPACDLLVVSSSTEGSLILQAIRSGAKEFLNYPLKIEDFLAALDRIRASKGGGADGQARTCQVITVAGAGGGVGCTSLAINLGCILAENQDHSVVVIDLDFALGDADVWLDIIPDYTIQDVAENITRLDYSLLKRSLTKHDSGLFLLPRPVNLDGQTRLNGDQLRRVIALLKATFTHLIIDVSKSYGPLDMAALTVSDHVLLLMQLDLPCLRNVVRLGQFFDLHDGLPNKVKIVANRVGLDDSQISLNKALETIGKPIAWQVPNDYVTMAEARNNGVPLSMHAPRAKMTRALQQLAHELDPSVVAKAEAEEKSKPKKGLFSFLGTGKK